MNTLRFEYMLDLEKTGSISKTAENFFISASAVSQCLKKEEAELGHEIFAYSNQRMRPTEEGRYYLDGARRIVEIKQTTYDRLQIHRRAPRMIRIAVTPLLYDMVKACISGPDEGASAYIQPEPETASDLESGHIDIFPAGSRIGTEYVLNHFSDLAVTCSPTTHIRANLSSRPLLQDRLVLLVPKEYLSSFVKDAPSVRDCEAIPFILLKSTSLMRSIEEEILIKNHISSPRIYEVDDFVQAKSFLLDGRGASFLPSMFLPEAAAERFYIIEPSIVRNVYFSALCLHTASSEVLGIADRISSIRVHPVSVL